MKFVTYKGQAPSALAAPDVGKIVELFRQQNEVLQLALTTVVLIPAGTQVREVKPAEDEGVEAGKFYDESGKPFRPQA